MVALLAACPVAFARNTVDGFEQPKGWLLMTAALGLLAFSRPQDLRRPLRETPSSSVVAFAYLGAAAMATVFSTSPVVSFFGADESHSGLVSVAALVVLFLCARRLSASAIHRHALAASMLVGAVAAAAYGAAQALSLDPLPWQRTAAFAGRARAFGTLGHPNHLGGLLAMTLPLQLWFVGTARARSRRRAAAILAGGLVLSAMGLMATLSRAAWLAGLIGVLLYFATSTATRPRRLAAAGGVLVALASGSLLVRGAAPSSFAGAVSARILGLGDAGPRLQIWRAAADAFREAPLLGSGLDTFALAFERHRPPLFWTREYDATPTKAHDEVLHALATQGILGGTAFLLAAGGGIVLALRALRQTEGRDRRLASALLSGWVSFLVLTLTGFAVVAETTLLAVWAALLVWLARGTSTGPAEPQPVSTLARWLPGLAAGLAFAVGWYSDPAPLVATSWPAAGILFLVLGAAAATTWASAAAIAPRPPTGPAALPTGGPGEAPRAGNRIAVPARIAGGAALGAVWFFLVARPYAASIAARAAEGVRAPGDKIALLERAVALEPFRVRYSRRLGLAMAEADGPGVDPADRDSWLLRSRAVLSRSARLVPADGYGWASLAVPETRLAAQGTLDRDQPFRTFDEALARDPKNVTFRLAAANAALELGDLARARRYASEAAGMLPAFGPPLAQLAHVSAREGRLEEAIRLLRVARAAQWYGQTDARLVAEANLAALLVRARLFDEGESVARALARDAPTFAAGRFQLARALEGLGRWPEARSEYEAVLRLDPSHPGARKALLGR